MKTFLLRENEKHGIVYKLLNAQNRSSAICIASDIYIMLKQFDRDLCCYQDIYEFFFYFGGCGM